jgi:hypothetical protein
MSGRTTEKAHNQNCRVLLPLRLERISAKTWRVLSFPNLVGFAHHRSHSDCRRRGLSLMEKQSKILGKARAK